MYEDSVVMICTVPLYT